MKLPIKKLTPGSAGTRILNPNKSEFADKYIFANKSNPKFHMPKKIFGDNPNVKRKNGKKAKYTVVFNGKTKIFDKKYFTKKGHQKNRYVDILLSKLKVKFIRKNF